MSREALARSSVRHALKSSTGPISDASHALVDFGDEGTTIIRFCRIIKGSICEGRCRVKWDDGQEYDGALIIAGMYKDCLSKQKELEREDSDDDNMENEFNEDEIDAEKSAKTAEKSAKTAEKSTKAAEKSTKAVKKRKRKQIKADNNVNNKKKKPNDDKDTKDKKKSNRKKDADSTKDDFILRVTNLLPIANGDEMDTTVETENNLDDSKRVGDGTTTGLDGTTPTLRDTITGTDDTTVVDDIATVVDSFCYASSDSSSSSDEGEQAKGSDDIVTSLKELKTEIHQLNVELNNRIKGIEEQLKLLFTSGIAAALSTSQNSSSVSLAFNNSLTAATSQPAIIQSSPTPAITPTIMPAATPAVIPAVTPAATSAVTPAVIPAVTPAATPAVIPAVTPAATPVVTPAVTTNQTPVLPSPAVVNASTSGNVNEELIHPAVLCPLLMKYKTSRSLAAALVNELFDVETRMRSNVRGRKKERPTGPSTNPVCEEVFSGVP